ncbi:ElyC/SanA/YdcF family protein [Niabella hibiscisoli]|uniref:ElyC/SanA/YdcF family protein n=1 Tax=Niabella hibiscisoli TaxID=1825928 RepID=UPI001F117419|nr:ElyC/SanA/YdcF family protein [Niabella hibiscisoli]MCH5721148.1 YdcF family protein [Niabella hibiscisoli]
MYRFAFLAILALTILSGCKTYVYRERPARLYREVTDSSKSFDVAIVPGVPFYNNKWDSIMKGRVLWADFLYKEGIVRNVIFSGSAVYSPYYEARIMGLYAEQLGIPASNIFLKHRQSIAQRIYIIPTKWRESWVSKQLRWLLIPFNL